MSVDVYRAETVKKRSKGILQVQKEVFYSDQKTLTVLKAKKNSEKHNKSTLKNLSLVSIEGPSLDMQ